MVWNLNKKVSTYFNKNLGYLPRYAAFTLAEILIVLGIIGIIAEITIPTLMMNVQKQEYVVGLKKAYSETNQALMLLTTDYGCNGDLKCTGLFAGGIPATDLQNNFGDALVKYFHVTKNCRTDVNQGCWTSNTNYNYDGSSGTKYNYDNFAYYKFISSDGMSFMIGDYGNNFKNCLTDGTGGSTNYSTGRTGNMTQTCGIFYVDVNGLKKPNVLGRDTFQFYITKGKGPILYPPGGADNKFNGTEQWWQDGSGAPVLCSTTDMRGAYCTGRIMEEGWEMNY